MARREHGRFLQRNVRAAVPARAPPRQAADPQCVPCRSNLLYGIIAEFCTETACPVMCAGPKYEYMWADGQTIKKPISCSAPRYVDYLLTWARPPCAHKCGKGEPGPAMRPSPRGGVWLGAAAPSP